MPETLQILLLLVVAYVLGSIPSAYLAGRWIKGIDIRQHGTGNVGGSNVWHSVAWWAIIPVAFFDIMKAALPAGLALHPLDLGYGVAVAAGLAAAVGHAWSPFLNFKGGRSLSCIFGTLLIVFPLGALFLVLWLALGLVLKTNLAATIALLLLPFLSISLDNPAAVTWGTVAMIILTAVKRIEANRMPLPAAEDRRRVLWRRLLLDRDIADHKAWQKRRSDLSTEEETGD